MNSPIMRSLGGAFAVALCAAPGAASGVTSAAGSGQRAPIAIPSAQPETGKRYLRTPTGITPLVTPAGCAGSTGSASFIGSNVSSWAGGYASGIVSGMDSEACDQGSFVGAGIDEIIGGSDNDLSYDSIILGGQYNGITGSADALIGGGWYNTISNPPNATYYNSNLSAIAAGSHNTIEAPNSFIGSGYSNTILSPSFAVTNATDSFIGGGYGNTTTADFAFIGGGYTNSTFGEWSTIAGGYLNQISSTSTQAFIGGGYNNSISGRDSMIPGGSDNTVTGDHAFAAGNHATAPYSGDFVWSDFSSPYTVGIQASRPNEFMVRATGGIYFFSSTSLAGVVLAPGSGSWSTVSDRNAKRDIEAVDSEHILDRLAAMPVSMWTYKSEGSVRHLGPMAQDFRAAFGLGEDDKTISTVDEEGVALAAIKALKADNDVKARRIADDEARLAHLEARLDAIETAQHLAH